ncbi:MAG: circularly permuted type 2 ATP-grasp protein, partial [bacterium]
MRIANQLGSGWAECPAVTALLPQLCKAILNEDLILQNSPMYWCGAPEVLEEVLKDVERYSFRDSFTRHSSSDWEFYKSNELERARFREELKA